MFSPCGREHKAILRSVPPSVCPFVCLSVCLSVCPVFWFSPVRVSVSNAFDRRQHGRLCPHPNTIGGGEHIASSRDIYIVCLLISCLATPSCVWVLRSPTKYCGNNGNLPNLNVSWQWVPGVMQRLVRSVDRRLWAGTAAQAAAVTMSNEVGGDRVVGRKREL